MSAHVRTSLPRRMRAAWFSLTFIAMFAWLDWILHRSPFFVLVVGGGAAAATLYREGIAERTASGNFTRRLTKLSRALLRSAPALLYFLLRASGTSGLGGFLAVLVALGAIFGMSRYGGRLDQRLAGFYRVRDRTLSFPSRAAVVMILPIVVGFGIIHGDLTDLPAIVGGTTSSPRRPTSQVPQFFIGAVLCTAVTILLLRRRPTQ